MMEKTVVLVKPDGVQRGLVGQIISRFEKKGLKLIGLKMTRLTDETLNDWYAHHKDKPFFKGLKQFMQSDPVVAMVWEGLEAVQAVRLMCGVTRGSQAEPGSIRGDFGLSNQYNLIHASDSVDNANKELSLLFAAEEIFEYKKGEYSYLYSEEERA
ncbi:nucleoside-diphosphate kinase [Candidatus Gottesmanbacteria bacterium]|nr:nucleoside-diphosphate kinase [Candidatus Gottesmanbacteria bacterium]